MCWGASICRDGKEEEPRLATNYVSKTDATGLLLHMVGEVDAPGPLGLGLQILKVTSFGWQ